MRRLLGLLLSLCLLSPSTGWTQAALGTVSTPLGGGALSAAAAVSAAASRQFSSPVAFPGSSREMIDVYKAAETRYKAALDAVVAIPAAERTFDNTVGALERASAEFSEAMGPGSFLSAVSPDRRIRRAADAIDRRASDFLLGVSDREDLYRAYKEYAAKGEALSGEDRKILEDTLKGYAQNGMGLPIEKRADLTAIRKRLSELSQAFERNLADFDDGLELTRDRLDGLPEDYIRDLPRTADGKYRVGLDGPTYGPFMRLARDAGLRAQLERKHSDRAAVANVPVLEEALTLRRRLAEMLGHHDYAELSIRDNMAESPSKVLAFLTRLRDLLRGQAAREERSLLEMKRRDDPSASEVPNADRAYYADKLRKERHSFDPEEVRQYFPVDRVIAGTLEVYQDLLGLRFREVPAAAWHPDVRLVEISDRSSGRRIGWFYLDLFPRPQEGKYGHAAAFTIVQGRELPDGGYREPVSAMVSNFSKPSSDKPALLTHEEVETFFHEFGHLMHQTLTTARYPAYSGTNVATDFVEAPSQMMENFVWRPEVLEKLSGHYLDPSRKLPKELLEKMLATKNFLSATQTLRQIAYATLDLAFHTLPVPVDTTAVLDRVFRETGTNAPTPGTHWQAGFGHLLGGYGAGYYGYLWSLVYAQDIFSRFEKEGLLSPEVGMDYRRKILERGSSVEEARSLREFLGREPNDEAFLRSLGLPPPPQA